MYLKPGRATASTPHPSTPTFKVFSAGGRPFNVQLVRKGERHGLEGCLVHRDETPLVQFYDASVTSVSDPLGQFAQGYYADTLLKPPVCGTLRLVMHEPKWTLDPCAMGQVMRWLEHVTK